MSISTARMPSRSFAAAIAAAASRSVKTTRAPSAANRVATCRPIPDPAPVTSAVLPASRFVMRLSLLMVGSGAHPVQAGTPDAGRQPVEASGRRDVELGAVASPEAEVADDLPDHDLADARPVGGEHGDRVTVGGPDVADLVHPQAVGDAWLHPGQDAPVLGHGPGIGLRAFPDTGGEVVY